jgi:bifunctional ADP-heptose synthase (sugar kinase/adenylyltransferase)
MKKNQIDLLISEFIEKSKNLRVAVIGETIIDEFIYIEYQGMSMKSHCPSLSLKNKSERQIGGAAVIANHLKDFVKDVELITNNNNEIVKTRYLESFKGKKHVEINKYQTDDFGEIKINNSDYDIVIIADFGHKFCDNIIIDDGFHLMCQSNSNNFGYNRISKWKHKNKKSVCVDQREACLQINKKIEFSDPKEIKDLYNYELNTHDMYVTLGSKGSLNYDGKNISKTNSFKTNITDTIGSGDTFFAFACLTSHLGFKNEEKLIIPSLAASISTTWLCNAENLTIQKLKNYEDRII